VVPRRKAKPQELTPTEIKPEVAEAKPAEVKPPEVKQEEKPQEVKSVEAKPQELSPPKLMIKEAKPVAPIVKSATWEEFEMFAPEQQPARRSWVKEAIERAREGPVRIEGLSRGQIMVLLNQVSRYNSERREPRIVVKYDVKKGVVLLAPLTKQQLKQ
jgi:hypothetical protein